MSPSSTNVSAVVAPAATARDTVGAVDKDARLAAMAPATPDLKGQRGFEYERDLVKKTAEFMKLRARKGQQRAWATLTNKNAFQPPSQKAKLLRRDELDLQEDDTAYDAAKNASFASVPQTVEVKLGDVVTSVRKVRKSAVGDFVMIPPTRSVIPLDDVMSRDLIIDEPWEHIYADDDDESRATTPTKASYADVLAK
ncbi:hypothetical protein HMN09_00959600 [Mycena chlorophos]|uniref:Uncharacterized protein n=1 Tax=Mycena chlorophos TaxID=658473 RepID=A0A8H6W534_MYCCL|nr:hypothetical protein HMN09_00959600 [Mycena chlorophos]